MFGFGVLKGRKTYVAGTLSIVGFAAGYLLGDVSLVDAVQGVVTATLAMTVRNGIASAVK